jgi:hypothetical protein
MANRYVRLGFLRSYEALKNIIYETQQPLNTEFTPTTTITRKRLVNNKETREHIDYSKDTSVIIAIQNDQNLISIILKLRKQKTPTFYMYVENSHIVCLLKNPRTYPFVLIRIPIEGSTIGADTNRVFNIPIKSILEKSVKHNKNTPYSLLLKNEGSSVNLYYDHGICQTHDLMSNVKIYDKNSLNLLFRSDESLIHPDYDDFIYRLYSTNIMILKEASQFVPTKAKLNLELTKDTLTLVNKVGLEVSTTELAQRSNSIIWAPDCTENQSFECGVLDSMFKQDHFKDLKCKLYYAFGKYFDRYIFMKISIDEEIEAEAMSLIKIFSRGYHVMEIYVCVTR